MEFEKASDDNTANQHTMTSRTQTSRENGTRYFCARFIPESIVMYYLDSTNKAVPFVDLRPEGPIAREEVSPKI